MKRPCAALAAIVAVLTALNPSSRAADPAKASKPRPPAAAAAPIPESRQPFAATDTRPAVVESFAPQRTTRQVLQATARFSVPMVALGDPWLKDPFIVQCPAAGKGRWADTRNWVYDFEAPNGYLPAGLSCRFTLVGGLKALDGRAIAGTRVFSFDTGGPAILASMPGERSEIDEDQVFLIKLDAPATAESVQRHAYCVAQGIAERIPLRVLAGAERAAVLAQGSELGYPYSMLLQQRGPTSAPWAPMRKAQREEAERNIVVATCGRRLPAGSEIKLVWGAGIAAASGLATRQDQQFRFRVRPLFTVAVECSRTNSDAGCIPFRPIVLRFSAPVPGAKATQAYLADAAGKRYSPAPTRDDVPALDQVVFNGPFPESSALSVHVPADLRDDAGRPLQNAGRFPLRLEIDEYPPLAKFSGTFGILEAREGGVLPVTLRNLEADLPARQADIPGRLSNTTDTAHVADWLRRVEKANERRGEWVEDKQNGPHWRELTGSTSVFGAGDATTSFRVTKPQGRQPTEVIGIPLGKPGFYVVELESRVLGAALLGRDQPRYVSTAALVTNLSVHLLWGRESSQVWVTSLDEGQPVAGADVEIRDYCNSAVRWTGKTDAQGLAHVDEQLSAEVVQGDWCEGDVRPLIAVARKGDDFSFAVSSWSNGIAPHDFGLSRDWNGPGIYHTVLDRPLFRAGETVSMKQFIRRHALSGIQLGDKLPAARKVRIAHQGSEQRYELTASFDAGGVATLAWPIPKDAKLGDYSIAIEDAAKVEHPAGTFKVEEYRLPTMRATVQGPARPLVNARAAEIDLHVAYLSGGGAGGLPVTVRSVVERASLHFADYEDFSFGGAAVVEGRAGGSGWDHMFAETDDGQPGAAPRARALPLTLDAQGAARITIPDLPAVTAPSQLVAELEYPDPNGELLTATTRVRLLPSELSVGIRREGWVASEKDLQFRVVVLDLDGRPVARQPVKTSLYQVATYSYRKRLIGGFYGYETIRETTRLEPACSGSTNAQGLLFCKLKPGVSGQVVLRAETRDAHGNLGGATTTLWVVGEDDWWFGGTSGDRMDALPEKNEYEPGDVARVQVRMPFRSATALVSIEREGVIESFVRKLSGREPVVEVPIRDAYAPNVYVSVLALRGRVARSERSRAERARDPDVTGLVDLNKPAYRLGIARLRVGWQPHRLDVRVTPERDTWRVRERVPVTVSVKRANGQALPAGGEIALAAVDEALLDLAPNRSWELLAAMMNERGLDVQTSTAQMQVIGKRHYGRKAVPHGGGGGRERARELFESLLLWEPRLVLDANGEARVTVPLNDSLSSFRIVAIAHGGTQLFGTGSASVATTQDLVLISGLPPLVREGDRFAATFTVRNASSGPMRIELAAQTRPALAEPLQAQRIEIPAGEARDVSWSSIVPAGPTQLQWTVTAREDGGTASDRIVVSERVIPAHPVRTYQATLAQAAGPLTLPVERPRAALPGRGGLEVSVSARLTGNLEGVRDYMSWYPYTCIEQNISRAVALRDRAQWDALMRQLPTYMDDDGLLRYFPSDRLPGDDVLTSYVLAIAHEADWEIPESSRARLLAALARFVEGRITRASALPTADLAIRKIAAIEALSRFESAQPQMLDSVTIEPNLWPTSAVIDWLAILRRVPAIPGAAEKQRVAQNVLRSRLNFHGSMLGFSSADTDDLWWLMISQDSNALRLILAVLDVPEWREDLPRLARGAISRLQRGRWNTTVANAWGVLAMEKFSAKFEAEPLAGPTTVSYDAKRQTIEWPRQANSATVDFGWPAGAPKPGTLQVNHAGQGKPWIMVRANAAWPLDKAESTGFRIARSVTPVEQKVAGRWTRGDVARVRLTIEAQSEMTWVVVDDPVPAGSTLLGTGLGGQSQLLQRGEQRDGRAWPVFEERRFDSFRQYYRFVPKGEFAVEYTVRLNNPGTFQLPATRVEAMYAPEMLGELPNASVVVDAAP